MTQSMSVKLQKRASHADSLLHLQHPRCAGTDVCHKVASCRSRHLRLARACLDHARSLGDRDQPVACGEEALRFAEAAGIDRTPVREHEEDPLDPRCGDNLCERESPAQEEAAALLSSALHPSLPQSILDLGEAGRKLSEMHHLARLTFGT